MFRHQFTINPRINLIPLIHDNNIGLFEVIKNNLHHDEIQLLFEVIKNNLHHDEIQLLFERSCIKRALLVAEELLKIDPSIDVHAQNELAFRLACIYGNFKMAEWLWQLYQNIDIHANNDEAFKISCAHGHLEVAKWLWQLDQNVAGATSLRSAHDVRTSGISFYKSIGTGERSELRVSEVALATQLDQNINIHDGNEFAFRHACLNGYLEIAQWLW